MPTQETFRRELSAQIRRATEQGRTHIEVNAGELHRVVGSYPSPGLHRMPLCCAAMEAEAQRGNADVIFQPSKGRGASLTIRYYLPR